MTSALVLPSPIFTRVFLMTSLVNALWINASEVFRYFVLVMPRYVQYEPCGSQDPEDGTSIKLD